MPPVHERLVDGWRFVREGRPNGGGDPRSGSRCRQKSSTLHGLILQLSLATPADDERTVSMDFSRGAFSGERAELCGPHQRHVGLRITEDRPRLHRRRAGCHGFPVLVELRAGFAIGRLSGRPRVARTADCREPGRLEPHHLTERLGRSALAVTRHARRAGLGGSALHPGGLRPGGRVSWPADAGYGAGHPDSG